MPGFGAQRKGFWNGNEGVLDGGLGMLLDGFRKNSISKIGFAMSRLFFVVRYYKCSLLLLCVRYLRFVVEYRWD